MKEIGIKNEDKIIIVGNSLGGYIAADYAIKNPERIENLVLIDSSGMVERPTPLLKEYLDGILRNDPNFKLNKLKMVLEKMYANSFLLLPVVVDNFISVIEKPGAKHVFKSTFKNSIDSYISLEKLEKIKNLPSLII